MNLVLTTSVVLLTCWRHLQHTPNGQQPPTACLLSQAIKYQSALDKVETAELHIIELVENMEELRITAMHHCAPVHAFMFDCNGQILTANKAALAACRNSVAGEISNAFSGGGRHPALSLTVFGAT